MQAYVYVSRWKRGYAGLAPAQECIRQASFPASVMHHRDQSTAQITVCHLKTPVDELVQNS